MRKKIAVIVSGNSSKDDLLVELEEGFSELIEFLNTGLLDRYTKSYIENIKTDFSNNLVLVKFSESTNLHVDKDHLNRRFKQEVDILKDKVDAIIVLSTLEFEYLENIDIPILYLNNMIFGLIKEVTKMKSVALVVPDKTMILESVRKYNKKGIEISAVVVASPYSRVKEFIKSISDISDIDSSFIVLDSVYYKDYMKDLVIEKSGKIVIRPFSLAMKILDELFG